MIGKWANPLLSKSSCSSRPVIRGIRTSKIRQPGKFKIIAVLESQRHCCMSRLSIREPLRSKSGWREDSHHHRQSLLMRACFEGLPFSSSFVIFSIEMLAVTPPPGLLLSKFNAAEWLSAISRTIANPSPRPSGLTLSLREERREI